MNRVGVAPMIVGRERENTDGAAQPVIEPTVPKERPVAAIVLNHKKANQKSGGGNHENKPDPLIEMNAEPDKEPKQHERNEGDADFDEAPGWIWIAVARNDPHPIASLSRRSLTGNVLFSVGQTGLRFVVSVRRCCVRVPVFEYGSMTVCQYDSVPL